MSDDLEAEDPTTGEGYTQVILILKDETLRRLLTGQEISQEDHGELVAALIRATGAGT